MKKGILSEIQVNRQQGNPIKSGIPSKSLQKTNIIPQQHKIMPLKAGMKQNLMVNCNDDDGIDLTKFDSNTCIDQGNDSKYENYGNDQQVQEFFSQPYIGQCQGNSNFLQKNNYEYSFHNNNNNYIIPDMLQNNTESSRNINKTFSVMDSICDDDQMGPRSINKETVNEIMKTMPKSAQQILQRIMGRNTEDGSKVTLNPSQNEDFLDEQSANISSLNSILQSSSKQTKEQSYVLSYSQRNDESYLQSQTNQDTSLHSQPSNKRQFNVKDKENQVQSTYQKILTNKQQVGNKKQQITQSQNRLNQIQRQGNQQNQQLLQQPSSKEISSKENISGAAYLKSTKQNPTPNLNKLKEQTQLGCFYEQNKKFDTDFDDFSFELDNIQKKVIGNTSSSSIGSKSRISQKQLNISNTSKNTNSKILEQLDGFLVGYSNEARVDQYISNQAAKYLTNNKSYALERNQDNKSTSQRSVSPVSNQKLQNNKSNKLFTIKSKLGPKNISYGRATTITKSPKQINQQNVPNEITFAIDKNSNTSHNNAYLNQQHQILLQQLLSKNQQNILGDCFDQKPQSSFFSRSVSPSQQKRSESVNTYKNQQSMRTLERCGSSLSQHTYLSNDRSTSSLKDGGLSSKSGQQTINARQANYNSNRVQSYINRIKNSNSSSSIKNSNSLLRSKTQETFFGEKQTLNKQSNAASNPQKSYKKLHSTGNKINLEDRAYSQDTSSRSKTSSKNSAALEKVKSQLNMDRLDAYSSNSTQRISPTFTSLSVTSNSKKIIKSPSKTSIFSNLDKILRAGRSKSPGSEKVTYDFGKTQISSEKMRINEPQKKSTSKDRLKNLIKTNSNGLSQSKEKVNSLIRTSRVSSYFTERADRKSPLASSKEKQSTQKLSMNKNQQKPISSSKSNIQNIQEIDNHQLNRTDLQKITDSNIQKDESVSPNCSLSNQIAMLVMLHEQQQQKQYQLEKQSQNNQITEDVLSSSKILQSFDLNGNSFSHNQQFNISGQQNNETNFNQRKQFFHGGSFFNDNSFGGQEKSQQDSPTKNINSNCQSQRIEGGFNSHISSISQDSYRNYESLEPRVVDSKTVNEIMKAMPSSAQQILQKIMSRGNQDATQVMINPTQQQNNSLPLNFSFDIEQDITGFQKNDPMLKKMTSSIIPQQDPGSIREDEDLGEDHACKQSNSTDIEQIVKQLNFENNSSSFASSSNEKRGRSSSLSKSFSSSSKKKMGNFLLNSNIPKPYDFNMTEDDLKLEARLQSLDKMINLSDNLSLQNKTTKVNNDSGNLNPSKSKMNNSYSQQYRIQQQNMNTSLSKHQDNKLKHQLNSSLTNQQLNNKLPSDQEQEEYSLSNLTPEQIKMLEELSKQQLVELSKRKLNSSQQSIKSHSSKSQVSLKKTSKIDGQNNESLHSQQGGVVKPPFVINPPVPKQFQNQIKPQNIGGVNSSFCNMSQQSYESFSSVSTKPQPSAAFNNSTSKKSINYYSNQKKSSKITSNKTLDKLNHSSQSTEVSTQIIQYNSTMKPKFNNGSKFITEDSLAIDKSDYLLQSNQINTQQGQFMIFKPQMSLQITNNLNRSSDRIKKLNDTLQNISSQLTMNQPQSEQRALSLQSRKVEDIQLNKQRISQRSARNESPQLQFNSISCTSLSAVPNISQNSVLNRSLRDISTGNLQDHQKEICGFGQDNSNRSFSTAQKDPLSSKLGSQKRIIRSNTCDLMSSQFSWQEVGQKRKLEDLQLTVNEKEAEIISLKLQVQDLQEVLEKQKFLQSSQKKVQKKRYNEIEEKIISSRINIGSQIPPNQSGSTKSVNSVKTLYSDARNEYSEQKFQETYPKDMNYFNSIQKKSIYQSAKSCQNNQTSSNKKDFTNDLSSNLDETEGSHLKLNASEIDLTYQINQFTINKNINHVEYQLPNQTQVEQQ